MDLGKSVIGVTNRISVVLTHTSNPPVVLKFKVPHGVFIMSIINSSWLKRRGNKNKGFNFWYRITAAVIRRGVRKNNREYLSAKWEGGEEQWSSRGHPFPPWLVAWRIYGHSIFFWLTSQVNFVAIKVLSAWSEPCWKNGFVVVGSQLQKLK